MVVAATDISQIGSQSVRLCIFRLKPLQHDFIKIELECNDESICIECRFRVIYVDFCMSTVGLLPPPGSGEIADIPDRPLRANSGQRNKPDAAPDRDRQVSNGG
jgi:hypothetical protein